MFLLYIPSRATMPGKVSFNPQNIRHDFHVNFTSKFSHCIFALELSVRHDVERDNINEPRNGVKLICDHFKKCKFHFTFANP